MLDVTEVAESESDSEYDGMEILDTWKRNRRGQNNWPEIDNKLEKVISDTEWRIITIIYWFEKGS